MSRRRPRQLALAWLVVGGLGSACAAPHDQMATEPASAEQEVRAQDDFDQAAPASEAEPTAALSGDDELYELERALAAKASRLRALGVELPAHGELGADGDAQTSTAATTREEAPVAAPTEESGAEKGKKTKKSKKTKPGKQPRPGKQPKPGEQPQPGTQPKQDSGGMTPGRPSAPSGGANLDGLGGGAAPDEAKAVRLSPDDEPEAASVCVEICALSQGTCELRLAICELADRHDDEDDYRSACERADEDCEIALEACRVCSE